MLTNIHSILFRADSSSIIGTGHIMRDLVLAEQFKNNNIIFATQELPGNISHKIKEKNYMIEILNSNDIEELIDIIQTYSINMIIIDHYGINYDFEKILKETTGLTIFVLDDTYERHYCDILLNHNIYAESLRYKDLVPEHCELRCGEKYTLLRDEFIEAKQAKDALKHKRTKTVFIAMGGSDIANLNPKIVKVLEKFENIQVNMVTTTANQNLKELQQFVENKPWVNLYINSTMIAKLMSESDLAIVTPSVTMNEIWYLQVPFVAIEVAQNQAFMSEFLIAQNKDVLRTFDEQKVYDLVSNYLHPNITFINFINLSQEERVRVLGWRNDESIRKWMYNKKLIALNDHLQYIESLKSKVDRFYFLVKENDKEIGVVNLTSIDQKKSSAEIGLYSKPGVKGVGKVLMRSLIDYAFNHLNLDILYANVYRENKRAINLYHKYGFMDKRGDEKLICMELKK